MKTIKYTKMDKEKIITQLMQGGILAFPTDTVFGLACIMDKEAIRKVYIAKGRDFKKPLPMMCDSLYMIKKVAYVKGAPEILLSMSEIDATAKAAYETALTDDTTSKMYVQNSAAVYDANGESIASYIDKSLDGISKGLDYLRSYTSSLGNNYSIIQTRQDFTEALIDVLETGSDNLVLADMNEESANYLALQTRQQLAINSLSLASQSAQSVLKLF